MTLAYDVPNSPQGNFSASVLLPIGRFLRPFFISIPEVENLIGPVYLLAPGHGLAALELDAHIWLNNL